MGIHVRHGNGIEGASSVLIDRFNVVVELLDLDLDAVLAKPRVVDKNKTANAGAQKGSCAVLPRDWQRVARADLRLAHGVTNQFLRVSLVSRAETGG